MSEADAARSLAGLGPYLTVVVAAALPTHVWRWLGVLFAGRLDDQSEVFVFVKAVATSLVAAVIAQLILFPTGPLRDAPVALRVIAAAAGFAVYLAAGKRLALAIATSEAILIAGWFALVG